MKDLRYLSSVIVVLASIVFVGCGTDEGSNRVEENAPGNAAAENGDGQNGAVEKNAQKKAAPDNKHAEDVAAAGAIPGGGLTLENSRLSVSIPKGWIPTPAPRPEYNVGMCSPRDSEEDRQKLTFVGFFTTRTIPSLSPDMLFESSKRGFERKGKIVSERMQKVAGLDAYRLEGTEPDDEGNEKRIIEVSILLDDCRVAIIGRSSDEWSTFKDQFDGIIDTVEWK